MKSVLETKYFSVKISNGEKRNRNLRSCSLKKPSIQDRRRLDLFPSKSNDELIEKEEEILDRFEETRLAEEALAQNLKLLKKQKVRFIRLQKILSRNVILIPLCALFSILSATTLFAGTLTDYYQFFYYDIDILKQNIEAYNNNSLKKANRMDHNYDVTTTTKSPLNYSTTFVKNNKIVEKKTTNFLFEPNFLLPSPISRDTQRHKKLNQKNIPNLANEVFVYSLKDIGDAHLLYMSSAYAKDNSSTRIYAVFPTHSGIWRVCNYLSSKFLIWSLFKETFEKKNYRFENSF